MKHRISFYLTFSCILLFGSIGALLLGAGEKAPRESYSENRMLAGFPEFSAQTVRNGDFMSGLESYLSDGMPARDRIINDTEVVMNIFSVSREDDAEEELLAEIEELCEDPGEDPESAPVLEEAVIRNEGSATAAPSAEPTDAQQPVASEPTDAQQPGAPEPTDAPQSATPVRECSLRQIRADGTYHRVYTFSEENVQNAIDVLNAYRSVLPEDGHVFFTQVPYPTIARAMQTDEFVHWECDVEETINANALPGVEAVSTFDVFEVPLQAGEDLYFHTDHHWRPRAACYIANAMLARLGISAPDYDAYSYYQYNGFYGSYGGTAKKRAKLDPDTIDILIPNLPVRGWTIAWDGTENPCPFMVTERGAYLSYLGGTLGPWRRYETGVDSGRNCLVIGDSYLCAFLPYLAPYYEEIHSTDYRPASYDGGHAKWGAAQYIKEHGISDVYVILSTASSVNSSYMLSLMQRYL